MKETTIIHVIKYKNPFPVSLVNEPVMDEFEYIYCRISALGDFDSVGDFPAALLETSGIACVNPKNPGFRRFFSNSVTELDHELGFSFLPMLAISHCRSSSLTRCHQSLQAL